MADQYHDTAVVLRTYRLGEADKIVVLMTAAHGKVRAVAKGVRRTRSKFGARLEPMSHVSVLMHRGRNLDIVTQAESVDPLTPLWSSLDRASQAMAALEAVDQIAWEGDPNPQLYRMLVGVLSTIAEHPAPLNVAAFLWKLLAADGVAPQLDSCVGCGTPDDLVAFTLQLGGVTCRSCRTGLSLSSGALAIMRDILGGRLAAALALDESPATHEVGELATRAFEYHIERRLKSVAVFERSR